MNANNSTLDLETRWVLGTAGASRFPTNGQGGATATAGSSQLVNAKAVRIVGILVTVAAAVTVTPCDGSGTAIPGLTITSTTTPAYYGYGDEGVLYTGGNVGITCGAGLTATLFYRLLT